MCQYAFEQELAPRVVAVEESFARETVDPFPFPREP